jgi:hypothetical protein
MQQCPDNQQILLGLIPAQVHSKGDIQGIQAVFQIAAYPVVVIL